MSRVAMLTLAALLMAAVSPALAQFLDYPVAPLKPQLTADAASTLVVDFSSGPLPRPLAARLGVQPQRINQQEGFYRGPLTIPVAGHFDPTQWTIEMVVRLPEEQAAEARDVPLGQWNAGGTTRLDMSLSRGAGPGYRLFGRHGVEGRTHEFNFGARGGGSGHTIQRDAPGQWVYIALGFDATNRRGAAIVRDMDGRILLELMRYAGSGALGDNFLRNLPASEHAAATQQSWQEMVSSLDNMTADTLTVGDDALDLQALRISRGYRPEILEPKPQHTLSGMAVWPAAILDPNLAVTEPVQRTLGYGGHRNSITLEMDETFVALAPGSAPLEITVRDLPIGLYAFYLYGTIDPAGRETISQVWRPAPMEFSALDGQGKQIGWGRLLLKQAFSPRLMQGFAVQLNEPGDLTVRFAVMERAMETARIREIVMVDLLDGIPAGPFKSQQTIEAGSDAQPETLTPERMERDDLIWNAFIPLNMQTLHQPSVFGRYTREMDLPSWTLAHHGRSLGQIYAPLDMVNPATGERLTHDEVVRGVPTPGAISDDGAGIFLSQADHPHLPHHVYYAPRAQQMLERGMRYVGTIIDQGSGNTGQIGLGRRYMETGDVQAGHDAALALVRIAYDFPALNYALQDVRMNTQQPDLEFKQNWSYGFGGKLINVSWSAYDVHGLIVAYDQLFPYIHGNQAFADAVHRFIPWVRTPEDVIAMLDRRLVLTAVNDVEHRRLSNLRQIHDVASEVLGPHPETLFLFDLTRRQVNIYPYEGTYQEMYGTALARMGHYHIGSTGYALGSAAGHLQTALSMRRAREMAMSLKQDSVEADPLRGQGQPVAFELPMDLSDTDRFGKIQGAADFLIDQFLAGGYWMVAGTASGGSHERPTAWRRLGRFRGASEAAVELMDDPRHAWLLVNMHGADDPRVVALAETVRNPILHNVSRYLPGWGGILEKGSDETDIREKAAAYMNMTLGRGHAHNDFLDLNLYGLGLPLAVDLGQRSEGRQWSRPNAGWGFLHNHAIASEGDHTSDPSRAGNQTGEPWMRDFAPPLMRGSYVQQDGQVRLDREVMLMQVGDANTWYAFDLQRLTGGNYHTWCFHGVQSEDVQLNVPMRTEIVRWTDRMLPERGEGDLPPSQRIGTAVDNLQAIWTATREAHEYGHTFMGGGVVRTVALEPHVLGDLYEPELPQAHLRATLLGHDGATVMSAKPFSQPYHYAFPFLWVQHPAGDGPSIYPAIYDWYRGDTPVVKEAKLISRAPVVVEVTTQTGQVDTYRQEDDVFSVVSRDGAGVRFAQLAGGTHLQAPGLSIQAAQAAYRTPIVAVDYDTRTFETADPLPAIDGALLIAPGRKSWVNLDGQGRTFTWRYDLLVLQSTITGLDIVDADHIDLQTTHALFGGDLGNRSQGGFVLTNEDRSWQFRHTGQGNRYQVMVRPDGAMLSERVFSDANADGFVHVLGYEIGLGDQLHLPASVILRRIADQRYEVQTNVPVEVTVGGRTARLQPQPGWQPMN